MSLKVGQLHKRPLVESNTSSLDENHSPLQVSAPAKWLTHVPAAAAIDVDGLSRHIGIACQQYRHFRDFVRRTESADGDQLFLDIRVACDHRGFNQRRRYSIDRDAGLCEYRRVAVRETNQARL